MVKVSKIRSDQEIKEYKNALDNFSHLEPYYLPDYIKIFSGGFENLIYFSFSLPNGPTKIIMPGYLRPILIGSQQTPYFDFISPYGYTGPLFSKDILDEEIIEFWKYVDEWYATNNVITEFIRFNLFENQNFYSGTVFPTMLNIRGAIIDQDLQWTCFDHKVRKNYNKAVRERLSSKIYYGDITDDQISEFYKIYIDTMIRTNAKENFMYPFEDFTSFIRNNSQNSAICTIYFDSIPVSSELLLVSEDSIYSFLGGTDEYYFEKRPNDFLKIEAINWAREYNKKYYILGGGYGFEDGIFKYKKAFFPLDIVNYYTGRKILNKEVYYKLVSETSKLRLSHNLLALDPNDESFFPLYNKLS